jgi:hypothetical protein
MPGLRVAGRQPFPACQFALSALFGLMPAVRTIVRYAIDALLIFAPLSGVMYFLFNPDAFNAFLAWLVGVL